MNKEQLKIKLEQAIINEQLALDNYNIAKKETAKIKKELKKFEILKDISEMTNKEKIKAAFDENGNTDKIGDPYRYDDEQPRTDIAKIMFNEYDFLTNDAIEALREVVKEVGNNSCFAAQILNAEDFAQNTKGSYPTVYFWR